jgi:hypothetical protein
MKEFHKNSPVKNKLEAMGGTLGLKDGKKLIVN